MTQPFTFDEFEEIDRKIVQLQLVNLPPPPPSFSEEELADAKQTAHQRGLAQGRREVETGLLQQVAGVAAAIEVHLGELARQEATRDAQFERDSVVVAMAMMKKLAPAMAAKGALDEAERLLGACVEERHDETRLVVRVAEALLEPLRARVDALTRSRHFAGKIVLLPEPDFAPTDLRVEWADGGAERRFAPIMAALERLVSESVQMQMPAQTPTPTIEVPMVPPAMGPLPTTASTDAASPVIQLPSGPDSSKGDPR